MAVCKFFQQGRCMFGDKCKNEHPQENAKQSGFGNQTWSAGSSSQSPPKPGLGIGILTVEGMTKDLTPGQEKPMWPLTSYGPGKFQPLLVGGLDESFEELRLRAVTAIKSGTTDEYTKYEAEKIVAADSIYTDARTNVKQAYEQARRQFSDPEAKSDTSVFGQPSVFGNDSSTSIFGTNSAPTSAFGKSAFGQPAFGQSAFSQPTNPPATTSAFGQPSQSESAIVKPASGAFGSSGGGGAFSAFAGSGASAFGSGSAPSGGGGFSAFATQPSAFGSGTAGNTTTAPSGGSVFGQSSFGSTPTVTPSVFGTPAQGTTASAFGQPSTFGTQQPSTDSAFGGSPFSAPNPTGSVFNPGGSASTNANPTGSVFGPGGSASTSAPANAGSVFGPGGSAANNAFSNNSSSPFSSAQPISAFNTQPTSASSTPSAFSQPSVHGLPPKPPPGPPDFANARSPYKPDMDKYDAMLPENYMQLLPQAVKAAFESEKFVWGNMPEWIPPKELR